MNYKVLLCRWHYTLRFTCTKTQRRPRVEKSGERRTMRKKFVYYIFMRSNDFVPTHLSESKIWMIWFMCFTTEHGQWFISVPKRLRHILQNRNKKRKKHTQEKRRMAHTQTHTPKKSKVSIKTNDQTRLAACRTIHSSAKGLAWS